MRREELMKKIMFLISIFLFFSNNYGILKKINNYSLPETTFHPRDEEIEIFYHDGIPAGSFYEIFDYAYGTVFNLNEYENPVLERIDFHHSSYGVMGPHNYNIHIINWSSHETISVIENLSTTVNDSWETGIELGEIPAPSQVGIFLEPLSNDPNDAYPDFDFDAVLNNASYMIDLSDNSIVDPGESYGDYLINLWISVQEESQDTINEDFFQGIPENWTELDADGDSFGWEFYDEDGHNDNSCVRSGSYIDGIGVVYPDNYLITPQILVGNENFYVQFWVKPFNDYFYAEHYKLKIAVTDSTALEPDYFTDTIFEETLQPDDWQMRKLYLSDYVNEKIYIAWEHCECSDQYYLMLDDIIVSDSTTSVENNEIESQPILLRNYPNPFRNFTTISFELNSEQHRQNEQNTISIYNIKGQKIKEFVILSEVEGNHSQFSIPNSQFSITWNGTDDFGKKVSAGIYLYELKLNNKAVATEKLLFIK
ncbi:MAG: hypothetical protein B6D62_04180 [Candidatus Cloacimonas sp. 4484_275]|nr:MAG: hypothetical protein B6D62_04180 [Candidatus Cloacimonas sp. 4484_275]